jgi:hypothetical protein
VPEEVSRALATQLDKSHRAGTKGKARAETRVEAANRKYIPVVAIVNGPRASYVTPAGGGRYRLQLHTALRKAARADVGDLVSVELRFDLASREPPVPGDLRAALQEHPKARQAFEELTTSHRRHLTEWFGSAKGSEARIRRLGRAMDVLLERALPPTVEDVVRPPQIIRAIFFRAASQCRAGSACRLRTSEIS